MDLHNIRESYKFDSLSEDKALENPFDQFQDWLNAYTELGTKDSNAMSLATVDENGLPHNRIVLLKGVRPDGFLFYTNYASSKGQHLSKNPNAAILFFWREQERQIRIRGRVEKIDQADSEAYFATRPYLSKIGAAASEQSQDISSREALESKFNAFMSEFPEGGAVPMPKTWGGYVLIPEEFEFWQGREGRLHDRLVYSRSGEHWDRKRLQP